MTDKLKTILMLGGSAVLLIVWDIYVYFSPETGDTISEVMLQGAGNHPVIPFVVGVVMGHLFWPQRK